MVTVQHRIHSDFTEYKYAYVSCVVAFCDQYVYFSYYIGS